MKTECERCHKEKRGVQEIRVRQWTLKCCLKCRRRIVNLLDRLKVAKGKQAEYLETMLYKVSNYSDNPDSA